MRVLRNVPFERYLKWEAVSASLLKEFAKSPKRYKAMLDGRFRLDSDALKRGRALHSRMEGIETFFQAYVVAPKINRRTKEGKEEFAAFEEGNQGRVVLTVAEMEVIEAMYDSIMMEPRIRPWVESLTAEREISFRWKDHQSGLDCKCRADLEDDGVTLDYKTTQDASPDAFRNAVRYFGYDLAAIHYRGGTKWERFGWIAVESKPPYCACLYWLQPGQRYQWLEGEYRHLMEDLAECHAADYRWGKDFVWPSYGEGEMTLEI